MKYIPMLFASSVLAMATAQSSVASPIQVQNSAMQEVSQSSISIERAMQIAKQRVDGQVVAIEYDSHHSSQNSEYEVKLVDDSMGYELDINANTGAITEYKQESLDSDDVADYAMLYQTKLNLLQAIQFAAQHLNGQVVEAEFDVENDKPMYELEVVADGKKYDVNIDALNAQATINED